MRTQYALLFAAVLCLTSCGTVNTGPTQHEARSIERDAAKSLRTEVRFGAGNLKMSGGAKDWMQGDFTYNVAEWKPEVRYSNGHLTVEQPGEVHNFSGGMKNEWDLRL